jgi:amino acid transporter
LISDAAFSIVFVFIFPSFLILRYKYPDMRRPYKVPGGMVGAWLVTLFPLAYAAIASYFILWPTESNVSSVGRLTYELTQFIPLGVIVLLTIVFYVWGQSESSNPDIAVELNLGDMSGTELRAGAGE